MRIAVIVFAESGTRILYGDFIFMVCPAGRDFDMKRLKVGVYAVFDCVLNNRLQGERRQSESRIRGVEFNYQPALKPDLLNRKICARMFKLLLKGYGALLGDRVEIFSEVGRKIQRDLFCFLRVDIAEAVNACHRVINQVRAHLQNSELCALFCYLYDGHINALW